MKILFHINKIPPNYGGGYLRVFKTTARFKTYGELYKIITYTRKQDYVEEFMNVTKNDIVFCANKIFSSFITLPWCFIKNRKDFDVFYVASVRWHTLFPSFMAKMLGKKVVHGATLSMVDSPAAEYGYRLYTLHSNWT